MCIRMPGIDGYAPARVVDMIYGQAGKPYVNRQLVPATVRLISTITPDFIKTGVRDLANSHFPADTYLAKFRFQPEYLYEYLWVMLSMYLSLLGFQYIYGKLLKHTFDAKATFYDFAPFLTLLVLPLIIRMYVYLNDFPNLFLFTLILYFMVKEKFIPMLIAFFFACINKETTILLTMPLALYFYKKPDYQINFKDSITNIFKNSKLLQLLTTQVGIYFIVKSVIAFIFRNNKGTQMEFHLIDHNLPIIFAPYNLEVFAALMFFTLLVLYKWNEKPEFFKKATIMFWPLLILGIFGGWIDEFRSYYYELFAIFSILITYSIYSIIGSPLKLKQ